MVNGEHLPVEDPDQTQKEAAVQRSVFFDICSRSVGNNSCSGIGNGIASIFFQNSHKHQDYKGYACEIVHSDRMH